MAPVLKTGGDDESSVGSNSTSPAINLTGSVMRGGVGTRFIRR